MERRRFFFIEPSKVDKYHITLIEGYLSALDSSEVIQRNYELLACLSQSTFDNLSVDLQQRVKYHRIPVVSQDKRHLVRKTLVEFFVVLKFIRRAKPDDIIFVTSIIPTSLILVELANKISRKNIFVVMHGELEALFGPRPRRVRTFSYWAYSWFSLRSAESKINLVVIAQFIKAKLHATFPNKFPLSRMVVIPHPIMAFPGGHHSSQYPLSLCFIGHRTANKGFDSFLELSKRHPDIRFIAIGGGVAEDLGTRQSWPIANSNEYLLEISKCSAAVFPYTSAYSCSLSAAALDALSAGVHILATGRACFLSLAKDFGPNFVTIFGSISEIDDLLKTESWCMARRSPNAHRLSALADSPYGLDAVRLSFESLIPVSG